MHKITLKPQTRYELKNKSEQKNSKIKQSKNPQTNNVYRSI